MDIEAARTAMIDTQVRANDVNDRRTVTAMAWAPRERFVPAAMRPFAYADIEIETGPGRWLWAAREFARLLQAADIQPEDRVLDVAPGAGYSSAVLSRIAREVVALEADVAAAEALRDNLKAFDVANVEVVTGPLDMGWPARAPFNTIWINGSVERIPEAWTSQLSQDGGRLAVVVRQGSVGRGQIHQRNNGAVACRTPFESAVPPLPGFEAAPRFAF